MDTTHSIVKTTMYRYIFMRILTGALQNLVQTYDNFVGYHLNYGRTSILFANLKSRC